MLPDTAAPDPVTVALVPLKTIVVALSALHAVVVSSSSKVTRSAVFTLANCTFAVVPLVADAVVTAAVVVVVAAVDALLVVLQADITAASSRISPALLAIINLFILDQSLQFFCLVFRGSRGHSQRQIQIAVPGADGIKEFLLACVFIESNVIYQLIQTAKLGGSDFFQLISDIEFSKYFVKGFFVAQIFRNSDFQRLLYRFSYPKACAVQDKHDYAEHNGEQDCISVGTNAAGETGCHCEQDKGDIFRIAGRTAETDDREGSR
ncbi:hypothetical protein D3C73_848210 [compost metagenome]